MARSRGAGWRQRPDSGRAADQTALPSWWKFGCRRQAGAAAALAGRSCTCLPDSEHLVGWGIGTAHTWAGNGRKSAGVCSAYWFRELSLCAAGWGKGSLLPEIVPPRPSWTSSSAMCSGPAAVYAGGLHWRWWTWFASAAVARLGFCYPQLGDPPDWPKLSGCVATDRILADACRVGYMYREAPDYEGGQRLAVLPSRRREYCTLCAVNHVYDLNTHCNYDTDSRF